MKYNNKGASGAPSGPPEFGMARYLKLHPSLDPANQVAPAVMPPGSPSAPTPAPTPTPGVQPVPGFQKAGYNQPPSLAMPNYLGGTPNFDESTGQYTDRPSRYSMWNNLNDFLPGGIRDPLAKWPGGTPNFDERTGKYTDRPSYFAEGGSAWTGMTPEGKPTWSGATPTFKTAGYNQYDEYLKTHPKFQYFARGGSVHPNDDDDHEETVLAHFSPHELHLLDDMQGESDFDDDGVRNYFTLGKEFRHPEIHKILEQAEHHREDELADGGQPKLSKHFESMREKGHYGDTELARIPLSFAKLLDHMIGGPNINEETGHRQYYLGNGIMDSLGSMLGNLRQYVPNLSQLAARATPYIQAAGRGARNAGSGLYNMARAGAGMVNRGARAAYNGLPNFRQSSNPNVPNDIGVAPSLMSMVQSGRLEDIPGNQALPNLANSAMIPQPPNGNYFRNNFSGTGRAMAGHYGEAQGQQTARNNVYNAVNNYVPIPGVGHVMGTLAAHAAGPIGGYMGRRTAEATAGRALDPVLGGMGGMLDSGIQTGMNAYNALSNGASRAYNALAGFMPGRQQSSPPTTDFDDDYDLGQSNPFGWWGSQG